MPDELDDVLDAVTRDARSWVADGKVADYIPALAKVPADAFGIAICDQVSGLVARGDAEQPFSIQSISKVFTLALAMRTAGGDAIWKRLGREPSGNPFNSLVQLEYENGRPRNPFINAGAIVVADILVSALPDAKQSILEFVRGLCGNDGIAFDAEVAASERAWGYRNAALANFLRGFGNLHNPVEAVLDVYFHQCALAMSCVDLARALRFLIDGGRGADRSEPVVSQAQARRINALMLTCGTYDEAGEFAFSVGLPAKSGVGGGIVASVPGRLTLAAWSPGLGPSGNSIAATRALQQVSLALGLSLFGR